MSEEISEEMWWEWKNSPVTKAFFKAIEEEKDAVMESIPRTDPNNQTEMIGRVMRLSALEDILQIDFGGEE